MPSCPIAAGALATEGGSRVLSLRGGLLSRREPLLSPREPLENCFCRTCKELPCLCVSGVCARS